MGRRLSATVVIWGLEVLRPILIPLFWIGRKANKLIFGPANLRISKETEQRFWSEIERNLRFLFDEYNGRLSSYESRSVALQHPRPFDYAFAVVALDGFSLRFFRGRGDFRVHVAPSHAPDAWEELTLVLSTIDPDFHHRDFLSFKEVEAGLKPRMSQLKRALAPDNYSALLSSLEKEHDRERAIIRQWQTEINRRLFPDK